MESKRNNYKYCIVPGCKSTTVNTPNKIFITIPKNRKSRLLWQKAMHRVNLLSDKTTKYCCEDHFNLEEDMENYMCHKLMKNVPIRLKFGVVPHIFDCHKNPKQLHFEGKIKKTDSNTASKLTQVNLKPALRSKATQCTMAKLRLKPHKKNKQIKQEIEKIPQNLHSSESSNTADS